MVNLVVSMTSTSRRLGTLSKSLSSILHQNIKPTEIYLWLSNEAFLNDDGIGCDALPKDITKMAEEGRIRIRWTRNIGPYRKLLPTLQEHWNDNESIIVTADDDVNYPPYWLQKLVECADSFPNHVVAYRIRVMHFDETKLLPYARWNLTGWFSPRQSLLYFPTGRDGVLYKPRFFTRRVFDDSLFLSVCPTNDDIWFRAMTLQNHVRVARVVRNHRNFPSISNSGATLWSINQKKNDSMVAATFSSLGLTVREIMREMTLFEKLSTR